MKIPVLYAYYTTRLTQKGVVGKFALMTRVRFATLKTRINTARVNRRIVKNKGRKKKDAAADEKGRGKETEDKPLWFGRRASHVSVVINVEKLGDE